jgi:hypothetical protein
MSALLVYFDEGLTTPFGGNNFNPSAQLNALDPQIDPYSTQFLGTSLCLYYQTTATSASRLLLANCGTSSLAGPLAGHVITSTASVINADGTLGTTTTGSVAVNGGIVTSSWNPALASGTQYLVRIFDNGAQIAQYYATP